MVISRVRVLGSGLHNPHPIFVGVPPPLPQCANECAVPHAYNLGVPQEYLAKAGALALSYATVQAIQFFGGRTREMF